MKSELPTNKELAAALGVSVRRVGQLKSENMPCDTIAGALAWREQQQHGDNSTEQLRSQRIRLVAAQAEKQEQENQVRAGELLPIGEVKRDIILVTSKARDAFLQFPDELSPRLEGLSAPAIGKILHDSCRLVLEELCRELARISSKGCDE